MDLFKVFERQAKSEGKVKHGALGIRRRGRGGVRNLKALNAPLTIIRG